MVMKKMDCKNCGHEASDGKKGLNKPSKDTACRLCKRNPEIDKTAMGEIIESRGWLVLMIDFPIDMYISADRLMFLLKLAEMENAR